MGKNKIHKLFKMQPLSIMHDLSLSLSLSLSLLSKYLLVPRLGREQGTIIIFCHLCLAINIIIFLQFDIILNNEFVVLNKSFIPDFWHGGHLFFRIFGNSQKKLN